MPFKPKQQHDPLVKTGLLKGTPQEDPTAKAGKQTNSMGPRENVQRALNHARSMSPLNLFKYESSQIGKSENAVKQPTILKEDESIDSLLSMARLKSGKGEQRISIKDDTAAPTTPPEGVKPNQKGPDYIKVTHMESAATHAAPYPNDQWTLRSNVKHDSSIHHTNNFRLWSKATGESDGDSTQIKIWKNAIKVPVHPNPDQYSSRYWYPKPQQCCCTHPNNVQHAVQYSQQLSQVNICHQRN